MPVSFNNLQIGREYTRPELSELWGYSGYQALARGAVTPRNAPFVILFITREKADYQTQYEDRLESGMLEIEGETNHAADERMINASKTGDKIHLFYRQRHHSPFTYYGLIQLLHHERRMDSPSRFSFRVPSDHPDDTLETELITHGQTNEEFIPDEEGRRIIKQHVAYERSPRNRRRALEIHGTKCMACGFNFDEVYGANHARGYIEIHHVRSITEVNGPVNPETDLVPLCSNCHSMAHRKKGEILTVEEIKRLLKI